MVAALREWITSVVAAALLVSAAQSLIPEGGVKRAASLTGGLILLLALMQPVLGADLKRLELDLEPYRAAVRERQEELEQSGETEWETLIAQRTAAYIWDKAEELGLRVSVRVTVEPDTDGVPVPAAVEVTGPPSEALAEYLERELGIARERQVWKDEGTS